MNDRPGASDRPGTSDRRVALITGATGALGRVLAGELAADGWDLALLGSNAPRLEALQAELDLPDDRVAALAVDLREAEAAATAVDSVVARFGRVDALAHLVGGWTGGTAIADADDELYESMLDQHLWATLHVVRPLVPHMVAAGRGRIVAVSSPQAVAPTAGMSAYAIGKVAEETLLATLAHEVKGTGVTVNVLRVRSIDPSSDPEQSAERAGATTAAEIAAAIRYLFSEAARVINGERIGLYAGT
jgi:NAD(P)-dependent dehydrogenase (short-subunit alcohol dehydrogenase family)